MKKRKIVRNLFGVFLATMTSVNTILPAYAEENVRRPQEGNSLSVEVVGDGSVTLSTGDFTKTLKDGEKYNTEYAEGSEVKITSSANTDSTLFDFTLNGSTVDKFENKKTFEYTYTMGTENAEFKISFKKTNEEIKNETQTNLEKPNNFETTDTLKNNTQVSINKAKDELSEDEIHIDFNVWNKSDETKLILKDYSKNIYKKYSDQRKVKAKESGLLKYCDSNYFLKKSFYSKYDGYMLNYDNLVILDKHSVPELSNDKGEAKSEALNEIDRVDDADEEDDNASLFNLSRAGGVTVDRFTEYTWVYDSYGSYYNEAIYGLSNGVTAFCGEGMRAGVRKGQSLGAPEKVDNAKLAKVLYYGYGGHGDILTSKYGVSAAVCMTSDMASKAYSGAAAGEAGGTWSPSGTEGMYNYIQSLPLPSGITVYKCKNDEYGTNWQGTFTKRQDVVYSIWNPLGKLCIKKTSAEPDVTNGNKYYSLKGAQYGIYKTESDAKNDTNRVKTLTIGNHSAAYPDWSEEAELLAGTYYVKEVKRPTNNSYALNSSIQKVTVEAGKTSNVGYNNEFNEKPIYEKFRLYKKSANPSMTDGNDSYDISGAQYGVYKSKDDAKNDTNRINTLTTRANGESNNISLSFGDYYIKEVANPKGYALDPKVYTVSVDGSSDAYSFMPDAELAQSSTVELAIAKLDAETNKNIPQGSASLEGALYKVSYYKGDYAEGVNPASAGVQPTRYWVVKTDKEGKAYLKDEYITEKSGDLYKNSEGKVALPLGTVTVEEIKAPAGYYLNKGKVTVRKLKGSGTKENIQEFVKIEDTEQVVRFYIDKVQEGTNVKISNVLFLHTKPDGSIEKLKTDADGQIVLTGPEPGVHSIEEIKTTDGYDVNTTKVEFEVVYNGEVKMLTNLANTGISFGKRSDSSEDKKITVENKVRPYTMQIVKTNQFNKKLKGAEFTLYADAEGKTKIQTLSTDANGILQFGDLKNLKTYYFKETKAPKGYRIPEKELNTMHSIRADAIPEIDQFDYYVDGVKYTASQNTGDIHLEGTKNDRIISIHIVNMTGVKLPETGSVWMIPTILLGAGCVAYVVYEECKKNKKGQNNTTEKETESKKDE